MENIDNQQQKVEQFLKDKKIKDALSVLGELTKHHHGAKLIDDHYNIEFTYKSMLKYTMEGADDPDRQKVYNNILMSCYSLSDKLFSVINTHQSNTLFYETRRVLDKNNANDFSSLINEFYAEITGNKIADGSNFNSENYDEASISLFNKIWVCDKINDNDVNKIKELITDESVHFSYRCIFISALVLGAIQEFCLNKITFLFDLIYESENTIKQRVLVGLLLILFKYDERISMYPEISSRLKILAENKSIIENILTITIQLIRTRETEKISKKLNDEILPEVVKLKPNLRNKLDLDNLLGDKFNEGENPDWEDFFKDSPELMSKLEELTELQMEGSDVFLSTFKMLKHFSFFNKTHNWFVPFYLENKEIKEIISQDNQVFSEKTIQESLANSSFLCNSDKYSLFLSIPHMPQFQKDMMGNMFKQQLEQMEEIDNDEKMIHPTKANSIISNRYIQDLYRFFKVHPQHAQFEDIFSWEMDFHNKWFLAHHLADDNQIRQIGEFFFKKEYFKEASEAFEIVAGVDSENIEIIQKIAYCYQQLKNYPQALKQYLKADILKPEQIWTTKKIALMYKYLKQPEKALNYYQTAERLKPDDLYTQASIGHCYLELKNYNEALKYYFKVEYLDNSNTKIWRPIGWCSFVTGKLDQAEKYYHKLLISSSNKHDLINMGHVLWCQNNKKEALKYYHKSIALMQDNKQEFFDTFYEDTPYLIENGANKNDIPILMDQLKYMLE